jgi:hypothetical protein
MTRPVLALALLSAALPLASCTREAPPAAVAPAPAAPRAPVVTDWALPAMANGAQPDLVVAPDGALLLVWIEHEARAHALRFARYDGRAWSAPRTVARGDDWFVNWADTPHVAQTADGALWAHWLRKSAAAPYAYDVVLARSADGGATWSEPVRVNDDGTPTEHGFVSLWPAARDALGVAWLDGRETAGAGHAGHAAGGAMTLRSARFDARLQRTGESRLDASTCDCCQTDVAQTPRGPLLVYRDRAPGEIRDIAAMRFENGAWSAPRPVHADGWRMPACPVNGPAAASGGDRVHVGWYTAARGQPEVRLARSLDAGDHFSAPVVVDRGAEVLGRVALAQVDGDAWIAWLREDAGGQSLWLARTRGEPLRIVQRMQVARLAGRGRGTGVPQLALREGRLHLVWTDAVEGRPRLRAAIVDPR